MRITISIILSIMVVLVGCDRGTFRHTTPSFPVEGQVSGLTGSLLLSNNGENPITLSDAGTFRFPRELTQGTPFHVTIIKNPHGQICSLENHLGLAGATQRTPVNVHCEDRRYSVGGTVQGLQGELVLQTQWGDATQVQSNGSFTMPSDFTMGTPYAITIVTQPEQQHCAIVNGRGIVSNDPVTNIHIDCTPQSEFADSERGTHIAQSNDS